MKKFNEIIEKANKVILGCIMNEPFNSQNIKGNLFVLRIQTGYDFPTSYNEFITKLNFDKTYPLLKDDYTFDENSIVCNFLSELKIQDASFVFNCELYNLQKLAVQNADVIFNSENEMPSLKDLYFCNSKINKFTLLVDSIFLEDMIVDECLLNAKNVLNIVNSKNEYKLHSPCEMLKIDLKSALKAKSISLLNTHTINIFGKVDDSILPFFELLENSINNELKVIFTGKISKTFSKIKTIDL